LNNKGEQMSADKILSTRQVLEKIGVCRTTLHNYIKQDLFPRPLNLGVRRVGWTEATVDEWINSRKVVGATDD
jgi:prophage regulatory protein